MTIKPLHSLVAAVMTGVFITNLGVLEVDHKGLHIIECAPGVTRDDIRALADWEPQAEPSVEIAFRPARVLMQDFTGVPAVVDLAAMRDAMTALGGEASRINPLSPAELVIDPAQELDQLFVEEPGNVELGSVRPRVGGLR